MAFKKDADGTALAGKACRSAVVAIEVGNNKARCKSGLSQAT